MTYEETNDNAGIDIHKLLKPFYKNIKSIILITIFVIFASMVYAYFLKPIYNSYVTLTVLNSETKQVRSILPKDEPKETDTKEKLEKISLILQTQEFIKSVIKTLDISQKYYIEKNFKKVALYNFENLSVKIQIKEPDSKNLYGTLFKITPIDEKEFLLSIDKLKYKQVHQYNKTINTEYFKLKTIKKSTLPKRDYYVTKLDESLLVDEISSNMSTSIVTTTILQIDYNDVVPKRAKEVVQKIADTIKRYTLNQKKREIAETLKFVNKEIKKIESILKKEEEELKNYQTKIGEAYSNKISILRNITNKEELIEQLKLQQNELKIFKNTLNIGKLNTVSLLNSGIDISSIQSLIERFRDDEIKLNNMILQKNNIEKSITKNRQLEQLISSLNNKKKLLEDLRFEFTEEYPEVKKVSKDIAKIEENIMNYIDINIEKLENSLANNKNRILHNIIMVEKSIKNKIKMFKRDIISQKKLLQTFQKENLDTQKLKDNLSLSKKTYTYLLEKRMELKIALNSAVSDIQIIENAKEPQSPIKPNKKLIVIIGAIFGFILALIYTFLKVVLDTKVRDIDSIQLLTNIPVYGSLPSKKYKNFFYEALRKIRTNIQFIQESKKRCTTILISSNMQNEGKTTVVVGLGMILSKGGKRVLLLDLDLRKPRLHQELNKSNRYGVSEYLTTDIELHLVIQNIDINLDFISAGAIPNNPSELLMSKKFNIAIKELSKHYDYILFDTPPIGLVVDATTLLDYSDIAIWVVRANVSKKNFIEKIDELKSKKEIKKLGIILNDLKKNQIDDYSYGYNYRHK